MTKETGRVFEVVVWTSLYHDMTLYVVARSSWDAVQMAADYLSESRVGDSFDEIDVRSCLVPESVEMRSGKVVAGGGLIAATEPTVKYRLRDGVIKPFKSKR